MKKFLIIILVLFLTGCSDINKKVDIEAIMNENEYIVIDVRTKDEYLESHIIDSINIPYDEIDKDINIDKKIVVFVYCRSGARSSIAFNTLTNLGYTVYDLGAFDSIDLPKE